MTSAACWFCGVCVPRFVFSFQDCLPENVSLFHQNYCETRLLFFSFSLLLLFLSGCSGAFNFSLDVRFHGAGKLPDGGGFWRNVGHRWPGPDETPGCCRRGDFTGPSETPAGVHGVVLPAAAPVCRCVFVRELLLLLHAQGHLFHTCALLLQVCERQFCSFSFVFRFVFSLFISFLPWRRTDCDSPTSFPCSYPVANVSLLRNKKHVGI